MFQAVPYQAGYSGLVALLTEALRNFQEELKKLKPRDERMKNKKMKNDDYSLM